MSRLRPDEGREEVPGGRIYAARPWVVEHCIGGLGVGTLIVKPFRHFLHVWELTSEEGDELGPLLRLVSGTISKLLQPDQIYVCLWSFSAWEGAHTLRRPADLEPHAGAA